MRDAVTQGTIWWDNNRAMTRAEFEALKMDFLAHARLKNLFVQDLTAGADPACRRGSSANMPGIPCSSGIY